MTLPRRRWLVAACVAGASLALAGSWAWSLHRANGTLTRADYDRVKLGMTKRQVEDFLGLDRLMRARGFVYHPMTFDMEPEQVPDGSASWSDTAYQIDVYFRRGRVVAKGLSRRVPDWEVRAEQWLAWLRGLVGL